MPARRNGHQDTKPVVAPYMHNGAFRTLDEVVDFYDRGGAVGSGVDLPTQTLPADSLHLSPGEKGALLAFMRALADTAGITGQSY